MNEADIREILASVQNGSLHPDDALLRLRDLPYKDMGFARLDNHRELRQGFAEAVYAPNKTPEQCAALVGELLNSASGPVVLSRPDPKQSEAALAAHPRGVTASNLIYWNPAPPRSEKTAIVSAGTADLPVAEECGAVLTAHGIAPTCIQDVGVSGIHRLFEHLETLVKADAIVVIAGMEGALPSVVGGLTSAPVVAVPTSAGYGSSFEGVTALLAMLSSCASGISVVGIDNGFGAAYSIIRNLNTNVKSKHESKRENTGKSNAKNNKDSSENDD